MGDTKKIRPGRRVSEFNPVPLLLSQKTYKQYNVLVGDDLPQQRFAEQVLGVPCQSVEGLSDENFLVDDSPKLFRVESSRLVVLSPQVNGAVSFWSLDPFDKGSAGVNAIVRYAASLLGMEKPDKELVELVADMLVSKGSLEDIKVALWEAVWLLTDPTPVKGEGKRWPQPWENHLLWFSVPGVAPEYRLNTLYWDMTIYTFLRGDEEGVLKKAGVSASPAKIKVFKKLNLEYSKVHDTIKVVDLWRNKHTNPYVCAFCISNIWGKA